MAGLAGAAANAISGTGACAGAGAPSTTFFFRPRTLPLGLSSVLLPIAGVAIVGVAAWETGRETGWVTC